MHPPFQRRNGGLRQRKKNAAIKVRGDQAFTRSAVALKHNTSLALNSRAFLSVESVELMPHCWPGQTYLDEGDMTQITR